MAHRAFLKTARTFAALSICALGTCAFADIVLGHSGDLSGSTAALTTDYVRGMNAYFADVNSKGGIRGEKIRLVSLDDAFNPDKTAENTKALIDTQNAVALVGFRGTANMLKIVPLVQAAGIAEIGNTSGAKSLRDPFVPNVFHVRASTTDEIEAAVNHAWTIGIKKIAVLYQDDAFGKEGLEALTASMQKRGAKPLAVAPVPRGTVDVTQAVATISAVQPQAVMLIGQAKPNSAFIKAYRAKGATAQFFVLSVSSGLHAELKEQAAGVIASQVVPYPFTELGNSVVREYQTILSAGNDKKFSYNSMEGFLNAKLVVRALQKTAAPVTRAKLIATLESFTNEDLGGFAITYGKGSNLGSRFVNLSMIRADGSFAR
ncbi:MAG: transporter permease [Polaromonas sp.]|nr:transporter permease [Polaromonas sp.]